MTQLLRTPTRLTIDSATLIDHMSNNHSFDTPDYGILDAGLTDYCPTFAKLPFSCKKVDDAGTKNKTFPIIYNE